MGPSRTVRETEEGGGGGGGACVSCLQGLSMFVVRAKLSVEFNRGMHVLILSREGERRRRIRPLFSSSSSLSLSHFTPISSSSFQSQKKQFRSQPASQSANESGGQKKSVSNHKFLKCRSLSAAQEMDLFVLDTIWAVNWLFSLPPIPPSLLSLPRRRRTPDPAATGSLNRLLQICVIPRPG